MIGAGANFLAPDNSPRNITLDALATVGLIQFAGSGSFTLAGATSLYLERAGQAIGRDVRTTARGALNTARNVLLREGIVVQCVRTVGVKRANTEEVIDDAESSLIGVRRKVRKSIRKLGTQDYTALNDQQRVRHCVAASQAQAIHILTLKKARDHMERDMIMQAMDRHKGNIAHAAQELGISRPTLYDIMKKHGLYDMTDQQARQTN